MDHENDQARQVNAGNAESGAELRFEFGSNWRRFLSTVDEDRIREAVASLSSMLAVEDLRGKHFLDIGSGSGLFSLAARRLGATVHSFDFDSESVACTRELKRRFFEDDSAWTIEQGSALDASYVRSLGRFDVVYSWGVLHHTGDMMTALDNATIPVSPGGRLYIAIYNDQGIFSTFWKHVKKIYCTGTLGRVAVQSVFVPLFFLRSVAAGLVKYGNPVAQFPRYRRRPGMSIYHDWVDWLGGYPFEVAKPEDIVEFYRGRSFQYENGSRTNRLGCNEFLFRRES
jgi:2-polyprenyl-6-hydroxyphenyl methylase/3-demethylubiquinone-9 3-methyltransferase